MGLFGPSNQEILSAIKWAEKSNLFLHECLMRHLHAMDKTLISVARRLQRIETNFIQPELTALTVIGESGTMLKFKITLPATPAGTDIVSGKLDVSIDGVAIPTIATGPSDTEIVNDAFNGPDNAAVHVEYKYVDDAGNESATSVLDVKLVDTIAPEAPGALALAVTEETVG